MLESEDLKTLTRTGELILRVRDGSIAARLAPHPALTLMASTGRPPEGLLWGDRFFGLTPEGQYVEGLLYPLPQLRVLPSAAEDDAWARHFPLSPERQQAESGAVVFPYALAGAALTAWLTELLRRHPQLTLMLGTRLARVVSLHPDGRLECEVETEALEPERQFVALEPRHLEQIVRQLPACAQGE